MFAVFVIDIVAFLMFLPITTNWLFMTALFVLMLSFTIIMYGACSYNKEQEEKARKEAEEAAERKRRFERGHLEDGLNPEQREVWDCLHHIYRTDEFGAQDFIRRTKNKHEERMATMKFWDGLCKFHIEQYWKSQEKCSACLTSFRRDADKRDAERRKLQKEGLIDEKGNYIFWDNFPDNWRWSDEELAALDKDVPDNEN